MAAKKKSGRKGKLVCEHLEGVNSKAIETYQSIIRDFIRGKNGIYSLYKRGKLVYVGLATDLSRRLNYHLRDRHKGEWDSFSVYLTKNDRHLKEMEALVMRVAYPANNRQKGRFADSYNLKRDFQKAIKSYFETEQQSFFIEPRKNRVKKVKKKKSRRPVKNAESGKQPTLAPYTKNAFELRMTFKGRKYRARVNKDGSITLNGKRFNSPSLAAVSATDKSANGWYCWKYKNRKGDWVRLRELRK